MSKREDKIVDHSIEVLPIEGGYVEIPLPARKTEAPKKTRKGVLFFIRKIRFRRKVRPTLSRAERIRKRDFEQAATIAIVANLLIIFSLLFIVIKTPVSWNGSLVTLHAGDDGSSEREKSDFTEDSSGRVQTASTELMAAAAASDSKAIDVVSLSTLDSQLDAMQFEAPPLSFGRSVESYEMGGVPGLSRGVFESLFPQSRFGDGSRLALFVDDSGSMKKINKAVISYVSTNFRKSYIRPIGNCKMSREKDPFAVHLADVALKGWFNDYVFVCDLQDQQTEKGINYLRQFLEQGNSVKRLHIISFDKRPRTHLSNLIESTGGTFTRIDRP